MEKLTFKQKFQNWNNRKIHKYEHVHISISSRKKFRWWYIAICMIFLAIFCGCIVMFYFAGLEWDPNSASEPPIPSEFVNNTASILLIVFGMLIFLINAVLSCVVNIWIINWYKQSKTNYQASNEFQNNKKEALKINLLDLSKSTLKWYKKLGYITSDVYRNTLNIKKTKK